MPSKAAGRRPGHVPTAGFGREEAPCGDGHVTTSSSQVGSELPLLKTRKHGLDSWEIHFQVKT